MVEDIVHIVIPAYNEEEALPSVLDEWYPIVASNPDSRMVVVNDGSKDNTRSILEAYAVEHKQVVPVTKENGGHGAAIYLGYQIALGNCDEFSLPSADYVFQTDSDGQTDPGEFDSLWSKRYKHDVVMGNRVSREDGLSRVVVTKVLRMVVAVLLRARLEDANVPYRLMARDVLEECLAYVPEGHNLTNVVLSSAFYRCGKSICYVPISFKARTRGSNSINVKSITRIGLRALSDFRRIDKLLP